MSMSLDLYFYDVRRVMVFEANITHNLVDMASAAGVYGVLWRPEENGVRVAGDMVPQLVRGVRLLEGDPDFFRRFDAANGWGRYDNLLRFVRDVLGHCVECPGSVPVASR